MSKDSFFKILKTQIFYSTLATLNILSSGFSFITERSKDGFLLYIVHATGWP